MPSRILREGILTSPRMKKLGWAEEVFYRRLMSVVDDFGRYYAEAGLLRAACYPRQLDKVSDSDIEKWLQVTEKAALVRVYSTEDGERYLEVLDFGQQIRAKKSKFPQPPNTCAADAKQMIGGDEADAHLGVVEGVAESEGVGVAGAVTAVDLSIAFRKGGVQTQPADPRLIAFAEQGVTPETVAAACAEAKRVKPNEQIGLGYVAKILERWALEAKELKVAGAAAPKREGAWWLSLETKLAKAREVGVGPALPGESDATWEGRIRAAIDNGGKPPQQQPKAAVTVIRDPTLAKLDVPTSGPSEAARKAMLAAAGSKKAWEA
jgi:hypothetical protein